MNPTNDFLIMSEAASMLFKKHEFEEGEMFGARNHTCDNEHFWKTAYPMKDNWKSIMLSNAGELTHGICCEEGDPNFKVACGHKVYEKVFPLFRPGELLSMLYGFKDGYFSRTEGVWKEKKPLEMLTRIAEYSNAFQKKYFSEFECFEEFMLAFYMLEVHALLWFPEKSEWI